MDNLNINMGCLQSEGEGLKNVIGRKSANQISGLKKLDSAPNISQSKRG